MRVQRCVKFLIPEIECGREFSMEVIVPNFELNSRSIKPDESGQTLIKLNFLVIKYLLVVTNTNTRVETRFKFSPSGGNI